MVAHPDKIHAPKWPRTEDGWHRLIQSLWRIRISREACCDEHKPPWLAFWRSFLASEPKSIWYASRGFGGKSILLAHLAMTETIVFGCKSTVLGGSGEQSQRVLEAMTSGWERPGVQEYLATEPGKHRVRLKHGGQVTALTASTRSVRGPHDPRLRLDEVDEMPKLVYEAALGTPMEQPGRYHLVEPNVVQSSTWHYPTGLMTEILEEAWRTGETPVYQWCWRCNLTSRGGWLRPQAVERKRRIVPEHVWRVEFDLQRPSAKDRVWSDEVIARAFDRDLGHFEGNPGQRIIIEDPLPGAKYATGVDWARKRDWTVITTFRTDVHPWICVAWERLGRMRWSQIIPRYEDRVRRYKGRAAHDETGIGDVIGDLAKVRNAEGFLFSGSARDNLLSDYVRAVEDGVIIYPDIVFARKEHEYCRLKDLYSAGNELRKHDDDEQAGGKKAHLPDSVASGALAWHTRRRGRPGIAFVPAPWSS